MIFCIFAVFQRVQAFIFYLFCLENSILFCFGFLILSLNINILSSLFFLSINTDASKEKDIEVNTADLKKHLTLEQDGKPR